MDKVEKIKLAVGSAMGLLYAFGPSLYVNGKGPSGLGIYYACKTSSTTTPMILYDLDQEAGKI